MVPQLPQPSRFPTSEPPGSSCLPSRGLCKAEVCFSAAGSWKLPRVLWDWPGEVQGRATPCSGHGGEKFSSSDRIPPGPGDRLQP